MANNGYQFSHTIEEYYTDVPDGEPTGLEKANLPGDPDYIEPILNEEACPIDEPPPPPPVHYDHPVYGRYASKSEACAALPGDRDTTLYSPSDTLQVGTVLYQDENLTIPANNGGYYQVPNTSYVLAVDGDGIIYYIFTCGE
jgi:hypothetical protein